MGRQVTTYFESLIKVTDILQRKCHIGIYSSNEYNVPIFRRSRMPRSLLTNFPAHPGFMDFRGKPLKSSFKKTEEQRRRKQRIGNRREGNINVERERRKW